MPKPPRYLTDPDVEAEVRTRKQQRIEAWTQALQLANEHAQAAAQAATQCIAVEWTRLQSQMALKRLAEQLRPERHPQSNKQVT
ncbi:hypothetical protein D3C85_1296270 [compost metagenome]|uniref:hypothetical protein n=1 Tax=Pseudomonas sp. Irchel s3h17 TaxID=2009182 RepID=UPI000BA336FD|nr:hypothetical protein [Pseudomonas sp. Irchel s3h17]